jgi:hypothetical protein
MGMLFTVVTTIVVVGIVLVVGAALYEASPFAHHVERFRDARGKRLGSSPRLD